MPVPIPDAPDYGRPVPRSSTSVQSYGVVAPIQQDVAAWTYAANQAAGAGAAEAEAFKQVKGEVDKFVADIENTQAQDALNALRNKREEMTTGENGFLKVRGDGVLKKGADGQTIYESFPTRFQAAADEIGGRLLGPARKLFTTAAAGEIRGFKTDVSRHGLSETEKYQGAVYKDTVSLLTDRAVAASDDPKALEEAVGRIEAATLAYAGKLGVPGEAMAKAATSDVYKMVIKKAIDSGDSGRAISAFEAYKGKLDAKDSVVMGEAVKTMQIGDTAKTQAGVLTSGLPSSQRAEEGTKQSLQFWHSDGYSKPVSAGITAGFLRESQFDTGAKNPRDGRDGSDSINIGQWNSSRAKAFMEFAQKNGLDPRDTMTGLKYAKAEIDGVIPWSISGLSPDLKARLQNAKSEKEAADIMTRHYFKPKYQDGESAQRQNSASQILTKYGGPADPLQEGVDAATGVQAPKNGPLYQDTRKMLLDADIAYDAATRRNAEINAGNEAQRRATQSQLDLNLAGQKRQIEMAKLNLEIAVDEWMTKGGPNGTPATQRPPPEIWNQLHYEKQKSIDATLAHNAKGQDAVTDQQTWYAIQSGLTNPDPLVRQEWANKPLWEYKSKLSNSDFQELAKLQGTVRKGDPDKETTHVRNLNQMVDDTLLKLKVDTTPKPGTTDAEKALKFRRQVQDQVAALERQQGKKSSVEQQQKIVDGLALEINGTGGWFSSNKYRYEMTIKDVPDVEKTKITDALRRAGVPVNDETIIDLFARKNVKPK